MHSDCKITKMTLSFASKYIWFDRSFLRQRWRERRDRTRYVRTHKGGEMKWGQSFCWGWKESRTRGCSSLFCFICVLVLVLFLILYLLFHFCAAYTTWLVRGRWTLGFDREKNENEKEKEEKSTNGMYSGDSRALVSLYCCYPVSFSFQFNKIVLTCIKRNFSIFVKYLSRWDKIWHQTFVRNLQFKPLKLRAMTYCTS